MKNEVNRAQDGQRKTFFPLVAKKKHYINPSVQVAHFAPMSLMEAASPATNMNIVEIPGEQW